MELHMMVVKRYTGRNFAFYRTPDFLMPILSPKHCKPTKSLFSSSLQPRLIERTFWEDIPFISNKNVSHFGKYKLAYFSQY